MRVVVRAFAVLTVLAVLGLAGVGWYYSDEILDVERPSEPSYDIEVLAVDRRTVTLEPTADARREGVYGLDA
ncbi:MAG: hypothetical protein KY463_08595, partial [Actinobacteria bacterium]|nr:hypothetical protein [Actinomycetota bacterium]